MMKNASLLQVLVLSTFATAVTAQNAGLSDPGANASSVREMTSSTPTVLLGQATEETDYVDGWRMTSGDVVLFDNVRNVFDVFTYEDFQTQFVFDEFAVTWVNTNPERALTSPGELTYGGPNLVAQTVIAMTDTGLSFKSAEILDKRTDVAANILEPHGLGNCPMEQFDINTRNAILTPKVPANTSHTWQRVAQNTQELTVLARIDQDNPNCALIPLDLPHDNGPDFGVNSDSGPSKQILLEAKFRSWEYANSPDCLANQRQKVVEIETRYSINSSAVLRPLVNGDTFTSTGSWTTPVAYQYRTCGLSEARKPNGEYDPLFVSLTQVPRLNIDAVSSVRLDGGNLVQGYRLEVDDRQPFANFSPNLGVGRSSDYLQNSFVFRTVDSANVDNGTVDIRSVNFFANDGAATPSTPAFRDEFLHALESGLLFEVDVNGVRIAGAHVTNILDPGYGNAGLRLIDPDTNAFRWWGEQPHTSAPALLRPRPITYINDIRRMVYSNLTPTPVTRNQCAAGSINVGDAIINIPTLNHGDVETFCNDIDGDPDGAVACALLLCRNGTVEQNMTLERQIPTKCYAESVNGMTYDLGDAGDTQVSFQNHNTSGKTVYQQVTCQKDADNNFSWSTATVLQSQDNCAPEPSGIYEWGYFEGLDCVDDACSQKVPYSGSCAARLEHFSAHGSVLTLLDSSPGNSRGRITLRCENGTRTVIDEVCNREGEEPNLPPKSGITNCQTTGQTLYWPEASQDGTACSSAAPNGVLANGEILAVANEAATRDTEGQSSGLVGSAEFMCQDGVLRFSRGFCGSTNSDSLPVPVINASECPPEVPVSWGLGCFSQTPDRTYSDNAVTSLITSQSSDWSGSARYRCVQGAYVLDSSVCQANAGGGGQSEIAFALDFLALNDVEPYNHAPPADPSRYQEDKRIEDHENNGGFGYQTSFVQMGAVENVNVYLPESTTVVNDFVITMDARNFAEDAQCLVTADNGTFPWSDRDNAPNGYDFAASAPGEASPGTSIHYVNDGTASRVFRLAGARTFNPNAKITVTFNCFPKTGPLAQTPTWNNRSQSATLNVTFTRASLEGPAPTPTPIPEYVGAKPIAFGLTNLSPSDSEPYPEGKPSGAPDKVRNVFVDIGETKFVDVEIPNTAQWGRFINDFRIYAHAENYSKGARCLMSSLNSPDFFAAGGWVNNEPSGFAYTLTAPDEDGFFYNPNDDQSGHLEHLGEFFGMLRVTDTDLYSREYYIENRLNPADRIYEISCFPDIGPNDRTPVYTERENAAVLQFRVVDGAEGTYQDLQVNLSTTNAQPQIDTTTTISWDTKNVDQCSSPDMGGVNATSGSVNITESEEGAKTYRITCSTSGGRITETGSITINWQFPTTPPTVTMGGLANNSSVSRNSPFNISYTSEYAENGCTGSNGLAGQTGESGSVTDQMTEFGQRKTYRVSCSNRNGTTTRTVTIFQDGCANASGTWTGPEALCSGPIPAGNGGSSFRVVDPDNGPGDESAGEATFICEGGTRQRYTQSFASPSTCEPTQLDVTITPGDISYGLGSTYLAEYRATGATSCTGSGAWAGQNGLSASVSESVDSYSYNKTFSVSCTDGIETVTKTMVVRADGCPASTVSWTKNGQSCAGLFPETGSGVFRGVPSTSGGGGEGNFQCVVEDRNLDGRDETYYEEDGRFSTCEDTSPVITFTAPELVGRNSNYTVSFSSTNADSCSRSGNWSGSGTSGSTNDAINTFGSQKTYTVSCTNSTTGSQSTQSWTVYQNGCAATNVSWASSGNICTSPISGGATNSVATVTDSNAPTVGDSDFTCRTNGQHSSGFDRSWQQSGFGNTCDVEAPPPTPTPTPAPDPYSFVKAQAQYGASGSITTRDFAGSVLYVPHTNEFLSFRVLYNGPDHICGSSANQPVIQFDYTRAGSTESRTANRSSRSTTASPKAVNFSSGLGGLTSRRGDVLSNLTMTCPNNSFTQALANPGFEIIIDFGTSSPTPTPTPAPNVTLAISRSHSSREEGETAQISWSASNATSCSKGGGLGSGSADRNGGLQSVSYPGSARTQSYSITCQGNGGPITRSTSITWSAKASAPTVTNNTISLDSGIDVVPWPSMLTADQVCANGESNNGRLVFPKGPYGGMVNSVHSQVQVRCESTDGGTSQTGNINVWRESRTTYEEHFRDSGDNFRTFMFGTTTAVAKDIVFAYGRRSSEGYVFWRKIPSAQSRNSQGTVAYNELVLPNLTPPSGYSRTARFGESIDATFIHSMNRILVAVGQPDTGNGAVHIYLSNAWNPSSSNPGFSYKGTITGSGGQEFGSAVAVSNWLLAVGQRFYDSPGNNAGRWQLYQMSPNFVTAGLNGTPFSLLRSFEGSDGVGDKGVDSNDDLGSSIDIATYGYGDILPGQTIPENAQISVIVGAPYWENPSYNQSNRGKVDVWTFRKTSASSLPIATGTTDIRTFTEIGERGDDRIGLDVFISDTYLDSGQPGEELVSYPSYNWGHVSNYRNPSPDGMAFVRRSRLGQPLNIIPIIDNDKDTNTWQGSPDYAHGGAATPWGFLISDPLDDVATRSNGSSYPSVTLSNAGSLNYYGYGQQSTLSNWQADTNNELYAMAPYFSLSRDENMGRGTSRDYVNRHISTYYDRDGYQMVVVGVPNADRDRTDPSNDIQQDNRGKVMVYAMRQSDYRNFGDLGFVDFNCRGSRFWITGANRKNSQISRCK